MLAFSSTSLGALLGAYQYVLANQATLGDWVSVALRAIPLFGVILSIALILIEFRTRALYTICVERARTIEEKLVGGLGHYYYLSRAPRYLGVGSHTLGIFTVYGSVLAAWAYLFFKALFP